MSLNDKYTRDMKNVNLLRRSSLEQKRSEVILRLSELDAAVKSEPLSPPSFRKTTANNQRPNITMSGGPRRKLGIERAPSLARKRSKPRGTETAASSIKTRRSSRPISTTRQRSKPIIAPKQLTGGPKSSRLTNTRKHSPGRQRRSNRRSLSPINRSLHPALEKYDPAFPTANEPNRATELRRHIPAEARVNTKSRSPLHRSVSNKNTYSRPDDKDRIRGRSRSPLHRPTIIRGIGSSDRRDRNLSPVRRDGNRSSDGHKRNLSPRHRDRNLSPRRNGRNMSLGRNGRNLSPRRSETHRNADHPARSHSPGRPERNRHRLSPGRFGSNHNISHPTRSRSPGHPVRKSSADRQGRNRIPVHRSNSRDRDSRRFDTSRRIDEFTVDQYSYANNRPDAAYSFDIPTNYRNEFIERSLDINDRDSRWQDTSRAMHSHSQSSDYRSNMDRLFNQMDRSKDSNDGMVADNLASHNSDRLRSRDLDYSLPQYANSRTREDLHKSKDIPLAPKGLHSGSRPSGSSKINTDLIRLSIVPLDYPKTTLTKSQADDIELALISHIKPGEAGSGPQFSYISFLQRTLVAGCKNMETKLWLEDAVPKLKIPNIGPLKILTAQELLKSGSLPKVTMFVPNPIAKKPASTLLTLIKTQNVGLQTENWRILGSNDKPGGLSMALLIDNESLATLEKLELKACLGLTQAKFTIIRGRREK